MTITFFSNFLNHHQLSLCKELMKLIGEENFHFVSCEQIHSDRKQMGYEDMNVKYPFVVRAYESGDAIKFAKELANKSDVAIIGSANPEFAEIRARKNKLTFLFRERLFKNGVWHIFYPPTAYAVYNSYTKYRNKNFYILCASAYAADDISLCGFPRSRCLKWGYFPEFKEIQNIQRNNSKFKIMWCGRMLWWKHPEHAIEVAKILKDIGIDFELLMVGNGEKEKMIARLIKKNKLERNIKLRNFMSPTDIRKNMEDSDLYLFTSGRQEGWGVVLNEAMNSGCNIIANINAGSPPYLIKNMYNGIVYNGKTNSLKIAVNEIITINSLGINAYNTIKKTWNPCNAAKCLVEFINNNCNPNSNQGPCSYA